jgi:PAS domain S-box-containing protein
MYGFETGEEMVGADQETLHGSDSDPANINLLRRFINSGYRIMNDVTKETDKDGNVLYISNNVVGIIENGKLYRTWGSQRNITEQVLTQQKIKESERRYRLLFETNPVPLIIFNQDSLIFRDVNQAMEKLTGFNRSDFLALSLEDILKENRETNINDLKAALAKKHTFNIEIDIKSKTGRSIPCEGKFDRINFQGQQAILVAMNDLTGIRDAEKMVIQSLIEGADNERLRVAKEIHDGLGQNLTAASLNLNTVLEESDKMDKKCMEKFSIGIKFLKMAIEESRNIAHNLMPKAIVDYGIILSLNSLFNQIEKTTAIKIRFYENIGEEVRLDLHTELNLFRITQEAINNVIKHAEASEIFVQLMLHANEIIYTFEDNGKGFDRLVLNTGKKGIGIKSIFNRAKAMSGYCDIDSSPGDGTTITVIIPIDK